MDQTLTSCKPEKAIPKRCENNNSSSPAQLTCRLISDWHDFEKLEPQWNKLLRQSDADCLFLTWEWINCWRNTAPYHITPYILVLEQVDEVFAIAPFYVQKYKLCNLFSFKGLRVLADQGIGSEYGNFIVKADHSLAYKQQLWQILQQQNHTQNWDFIWLTNIASWTEGGQNFEQSLFSQSHLHSQHREVEFASTALQQFSDDDKNTDKLDERILVKLSKSLRTNIKQTTKRLTKVANIEYRFSDTHTLSRDLDSLFTLHNQRWQLAGIVGSFAKRPQLQHFYQAFAPIALTNQQLQLVLLEHDGKVKAAQYGYIYNQQFLAIQEGFDPREEKGLGQVLRLHAFNQCCQQKLTKYDFLGGYTNHKRRWLADKLQGKDIFVYNNKLKNTLFRLNKIWPSGRALVAVNN